MSNFKTKRIVNRELIDFVKTLECIICRQSPCDAHHVTSVGARGDDVATNLMPLCRADHQLLHLKGLRFMIQNFPSCKIWLQNAGRNDILSKYEIR
jgi:hypothetical protein